MRKILIAVGILILVDVASCQSLVTFSNVKEAIDYASAKAASLKTSNEHYVLSKYELLTAKLGILDPKVSVSASAINNTQLPVSFLPGEIFGSPGTLQEVQLGQQYVSAINVSPQIELINMTSWTELKSAKLGSKLAEVNDLLAKKTLAESVSAAYFNVVSYQQQLKLMKKNLLNNDSILHTVINKFEQGIVRQQDVNQAKVNRLLIEDKVNQLEVSINQQIIALKVLCELESELVLKHTVENNENPINRSIENDLLGRQGALEREVAYADLRAAQRSQLPTLSLVGNWSAQDNSNEGFFDSESSSFQTSYVGLRLTYNLPGTSYMSQTRMAKANYKIAAWNYEHDLLQEKANNDQLMLDLEKISTSMELSAEILKLKEDNYLKNKNIYHQDLLSTDNLLQSLNDKINAAITYEMNKANTQHIQTKLSINQQYR